MASKGIPVCLHDSIRLAFVIVAASDRLASITALPDLENVDIADIPSDFKSVQLFHNSS